MRSFLGEISRAISNKAAPAGPPVPYSGRRAGGGFFARGTADGDREAQAAAYGGNGTLFAIVGGIAVDVAAVDWKLWRKTKSGKKEDRTEVTQHAALDVWNRPNRFMPRQEHVEIVQQHIDLTGEGWNLFARAGMVDWPVELWPVFPHRMEPVPDPKKFLAGYVYASPDGEKVPLQTRDVALLRQPHPLDMMRGLGVVQAIGTDLESTKAAGEWNRNFFLNSAEPGGIIEVPNALSDADFDQLAERWREQHQGVGNAHRVAILEHGKWVDRKYTQKDMQFVELRGVSREAIREAYRYPLSKLGNTQDTNRASALAMDTQYAKEILLPRLMRWKGMLNHEFLPQFGPTAAGLEFDFESPVPEDEKAENAERESKARSAQIYVTAGYTRESVKDALELPDALEAEERPEPAPAPTENPAAPVEEPAVPVEDATWRRLVASITNTEPGEPDYEELQSQWEAAVAALLMIWPVASDALVNDLVAQVREAIDADDIAALGALVADPAVVAQIASLIGARGAVVASQAAAAVVAEASAQGVTVDTPPEPGAAHAAAVAAVVAGVIAAGYAAAAARKALQVIGLTSAEVVAAVRDALADLGSAQRGLVADNLGAAMSAAQSAGRVAVMRAVVGAGHDVRFIGREVNDKNQCLPCGEAADREYPTLADALAAYPNSGLATCLGGTRCRGSLQMVIAT